MRKLFRFNSKKSVSSKENVTVSNNSVIKDFYLTNPVDLTFLTHCNWRYFRFYLSNGRFFKIPYPIRNSDSLYKFILKRKPLDVYYSTSCFLSPHSVGSKTNIFSDNLFLFADLAFDIDGKGFSNKNIEKARKETVKLLSFLDNKKIEIKYIAFSGSKGFHVICEEPNHLDKANLDSPLKREEQAKEFRKILIKEVLDHNINIDTRVTIDCRRIIRVPGTINSKSGLCCRIISRDELVISHAKEIINQTKKININTLKREIALKFHGQNDGDDSKSSFITRFIRSRSKPKFIPYYYASFLSNRVASTKLYVPIINSKKTKEKRVVDQITSIMETYKLSDAFLFKGFNISSSYFAIIPTALQKRRVEKILKAANSTNLSSFQKYHQTFTRISAKVDIKLNTLVPSPKFVRHITIDLGEVNKPISASHQQFLIDNGIKFTKFQRLVGSKNYIIRHTVIES